MRVRRTHREAPRLVAVAANPRPTTTATGMVVGTQGDEKTAAASPESSAVAASTAKVSMKNQAAELRSRRPHTDGELPSSSSSSSSSSSMGTPLSSRLTTLGVPTTGLEDDDGAAVR